MGRSSADCRPRYRRPWRREGQAQGSDVLPAEKYKLKGTWTLENVRAGETEIKTDSPLRKSLNGLRLTFEDDYVLMQVDGATKPHKEVYKLDATKSPKQLDIGQGPSRREFIYKFDGDRLILAYCPGVLVAGGTFAEVQRRTLRPRDFKETTETATPYVWVLNRVKR